MNCVDITGRVKEVIDDNYRYFEYELPFLAEPEGKIPLIVTRFWTNVPKSRLIVLPLNTRVIIHGHLEAHEKFGTILIVEQLEVLHKWENSSNTLKLS